MKYFIMNAANSTEDDTRLRESIGTGLSLCFSVCVFMGGAGHVCLCSCLWVGSYVSQMPEEVKGPPQVLSPGICFCFGSRSPIDFTLRI